MAVGSSDAEGVEVKVDVTLREADGSSDGESDVVKVVVTEREALLDRERDCSMLSVAEPDRLSDKVSLALTSRVRLPDSDVEYDPVAVSSLVGVVDPVTSSVGEDDAV